MRTARPGRLLISSSATRVISTLVRCRSLTCGKMTSRSRSLFGRASPRAWKPKTTTRRGLASSQETTLHDRERLACRRRYSELACPNAATACHGAPTSHGSARWLTGPTSARAPARRRVSGSRVGSRSPSRNSRDARPKGRRLGSANQQSLRHATHGNAVIVELRALRAFTSMSAQASSDTSLADYST
jgi:hypothetical protein